MEKSQGRVRNYVVSEKYSFCSLLAKTLCKMQVQYVQVDNEFHFNDKILRFYTFEECLELGEQGQFVCFEGDKIVILNPQSLLFTKDKDDLNRVFLNPEDDFVSADEYEFEGKEDKGFSYTKKKRQQDNAMVNQKLRQNVDMSKRFVNRRRNYL